MVAPDKLSALPGLYADLLAQPRMPVVRGFLPSQTALYVFYVQDEPVLTGAAPYLDEKALLFSSFRASMSLLLMRDPTQADSIFSTFRRRAVPFRPLSRPPIEARWLQIEDDEHRLMLEVFAAQKLGLAVSHPKVREWLDRLHMQQLQDVSL